MTSLLVFYLFVFAYVSGAFMYHDATLRGKGKGKNITHSRHLLIGVVALFIALVLVYTLSTICQS